MSSSIEPDSRIDAALEAHRAGQLDAAARLYEEVLADYPDHFDALHMLGVVHHQQGEHGRAIDILRKAISTGIQDAAVFSNLGAAFNAAGRPEEAQEVLLRSLELNSRSPQANNNLGNACRSLKQNKNAINAYKRAISIDPSYVDACNNLAGVYLATKEFDKAEEQFSKVVTLDPDNAVARHMLASLHGEAVSRAPDEHVRELFDHYSSYFDTHLVRELGYDIPKRISSMVRSIEENITAFENVLDLGCGTGLSGKYIKDITKYLVGVDLSPKMINKAKLQGIYDELHAGEIEKYLVSDRRKYDLIICADVFPYIGDLENLFKEISSHVRPGGMFYFSTEKSVHYPYRLQQTGRFAHAEEYLKRLSELYGFLDRTCETVNIRKQGSEWITGNLMVLQRLPTV